MTTKTYPVQDKCTSYLGRPARLLTSLIGSKQDGKRIVARVWMDTFEVETPRFLEGNATKGTLKEHGDHNGLGITSKEAFCRMKSMTEIIEA